jgi:tetratricopeptide (TPR) repeat protein
VTPSIRRGAALAAMALAAWIVPAPSLAQAPATARPAPAYVGTATCASCHSKEHEAWRGSHHDRAMEEANGKTVLGNFDDARFVHEGVATRFFRRDGKYIVHTDGPGGKLADFPVRYTFGVYPLQQYLIELPGGRLQAFGIAWDARPKAEGGQRWFHLYPGRKLKAGDPLHWTGIDQNWNYQCADCHSTNLRKGYDAASGTYKTTWSEIDVGCEACHGPGGNHAAWARLAPDARRADASKGLTVALDERRGVTWTMDPASGNGARSAARSSSREIDTCVRCHSRRGQFDDAWHPGLPVGNAFRLATLEPGLYYADGQMRDEVYNHGSFLQSRMHAKGVTCSDCHEPHSQKLRAPGNAVCAQCHAPARYDVTAHHKHKAGTPGAQCAACHMPTTTYMVVDPRHDHSMRIPRPDRTVALGTPNACGSCHARQGAKWAADAVARWHPGRKPGEQTFAEAFAAGERGGPGAREALAKLASDPAQPAFVRASALARAGLQPGREVVLVKSLEDADPLVRATAARQLRESDPALRARVLPRLLGDPVREVRMEAARGLAGPAERRLADAERARFDAAMAEFEAAARFNADRPEALTELGALALARGRPDSAVDAFRAALKLDPSYAPASVNLADYYRSRGMEREAQDVLQAALKADPAAAAPRHALGLSLARQKRMPEAIAALGAAARLAPQEARYAYVYAVALYDSGRRAEALKVLEGALAKQPYDRDVLFALASYEREKGDTAKALQRAKLLVELEPDNQDLRRFAQDLASRAKPVPQR